MWSEKCSWGRWHIHKARSQLWPCRSLYVKEQKTKVEHPGTELRGTQSFQKMQVMVPHHGCQIAQGAAYFSGNLWNLRVTKQDYLITVTNSLKQTRVVQKGPWWHGQHFFLFAVKKKGNLVLLIVSDVSNILSSSLIPEDSSLIASEGRRMNFFNDTKYLQNHRDTCMKKSLRTTSPMGVMDVT